MADVVDKETRSRMMSGIKGKDTKPEFIIRKSLHALGYRYKLHDKNLPGKPDLVFPKYRAVIFINGCFWHGHGCHLFKWPKTRESFWRKKITRTIETDRVSQLKLTALGWRILIIWECALKSKTKLPYNKLQNLIETWLQSQEKYLEIKGLEEEK